MRKPILFSAWSVNANREGRKNQTRRIIEKALSMFNGEVDEVAHTVCRAREPGWIAWFGKGGSVRPGLTVEECTKEIYAKGFNAPYEVGDEIWSREAWRTGKNLDKYNATQIAEMAKDCGYHKEGSLNPCCPIWYEADGQFRPWGDQDVTDFGEPGRYRHARFMPEWASRDSYIVTGVKAERLFDISEEDGWDEGIPRVNCLDCDAHIGVHQAGKFHDEDPRNDYFDLFESINGKAIMARNPQVFAYTYDNWAYNEKHRKVA